MRVKVEFETDMKDSATGEDIKIWLMTSLRAGLAVSNVIANDQHMGIDNVVVRKI